MYQFWWLVFGLAIVPKAFVCEVHEGSSELSQSAGDNQYLEKMMLIGVSRGSHKAHLSRGDKIAQKTTYSTITGFQRIEFLGYKVNSNTT